MGSLRRRLALKAPVVACGVIFICVVASIILTDPSPSTLPRRSRELVGEVASRVWPRSQPEALQPLVDFPVVRADETGPEISDADFVVGVELNGQSRAYPLNFLSRPDHHVLNDTLGGEAILVTWCGLCQSPLVYSRRVDGKTLSFLATGELYGENMLMQDVESGSDWPQMLGAATRGPLDGKSLEQVPSVWTDWKSWRLKHPDTTLPNIAPTVRYYRHNPDPNIASAEERYFSSMQWGLAHGGESISWPLKEIALRVAVNDELAGLPFLLVFEPKSATIAAFDRRVAGKVLTFQAEAGRLTDKETDSRWDYVTGQAIGGPLAGQRLTPVTGVVSHLRAWRTLHPATSLRGGDAK